MNKGWEGGLLMLEMSGEWYFFILELSKTEKAKKAFRNIPIQSVSDRKSPTGM